MLQVPVGNLALYFINSTHCTFALYIKLHEVIILDMKSTIKELLNTSKRAYKRFLNSNTHKKLNV